MTAPLWTTVLLGVALGAANAAASMLLVRMARGRSQQEFVVIVIGGMVARMAALLAAVAAVLVWAPAHRAVFIGALAASVGVGLVAEIVLLTRPRRVSHV